MSKEQVLLVHPLRNEEYIIGCIHVHDQEFVKAFYFVEAILDGSFPNGLSTLIKSLDDRASILNVVNSQALR